MNPQRLQQLENIVLLSKDMLNHAKQGDWAQVTELEAGRRTLVMRCFRQPVRYQDAPQVAAAIKEILHLNQMVSDLVSAHQDAVGIDIRNNKQGRTARAAYLDCAG